MKHSPWEELTPADEGSFESVRFVTQWHHPHSDADAQHQDAGDAENHVCSPAAALLRRRDVSGSQWLHRRHVALPGAPRVRCLLTSELRSCQDVYLWRDPVRVRAGTRGHVGTAPRVFGSVRRVGCVVIGGLALTGLTQEVCSRFRWKLPGWLALGLLLSMSMCVQRSRSQQGVKDSA